MLKKDGFFDSYTTIEKIKFIEELGVGEEVSENYYLLNIIRNEAIHCKINTDNYTRLYETRKLNYSTAYFIYMIIQSYYFCSL